MIIKIEINTGDNLLKSDSIVKLINNAGQVVEKVIDKAIKDEGAQNDDKS